VDPEFVAVIWVDSRQTVSICLLADMASDFFSSWHRCLLASIEHKTRCTIIAFSFSKGIEDLPSRPLPCRDQGIFKSGPAKYLLNVGEMITKHVVTESRN
jgi:hypothetical protein